MKIMFRFVNVNYLYSNYRIWTRGSPRDLGDPTDLDRPTSTDLVARVARRGAPSRPELLRVARPSRFERPKSTEKVARAAPRRDFRRFLVDFGVDFRGFSLLTARALLESIFGSIFILFQGSLARVSRLASKGPTLEFIAMGSVS